MSAPPIPNTTLGPSQDSQDAGIQHVIAQMEVLGYPNAENLVGSLITHRVFSSPPVATRPPIPAAPQANREMSERRFRDGSDEDPVRRRLVMGDLDLNQQVGGLVAQFGQHPGQHPGFAHPPSPHNQTPSGVENTRPDDTPLP